MSFFKPKNQTNSSGSSSHGSAPFIGVQAKLNIGKSDDKYEKEADSVADKVVNKKGLFGNEPFISPTPAIQRSQEGEQEIQKSDSEEQIQEKSIHDSITPLVQRQMDESEVQKSSEEEIQQKSEEDEVQMSGEEEIQQKSDESDVQMSSKLDVQKSGDEEIQEKEEEIQEKEDESDLQTKGMDAGGGADESEIQTSLLSKDSEVQQKSEEEVQTSKEEDLQTSLLSKDSEIQQSNDSGAGDTSALESNLSRSKGGGSPMDSDTKGQMESGFGTDFSGVRIHNDSNAVQMNKDLGSQAFANGNDIYFNEGKYNPSSKEGQHLLAHELTHTVQQGASTQPAAQTSIQKAAEAPEPAEAPALKPSTPLDISHKLNITGAWAKYLDAEYAKKKGPIDIDVKIGERYSGTIEVSRKKGTDEGELAKYEITRGTKKKFLKINGWSFLQPLRDAGIEPVLVLNKFGDEQVTTGFLSVAIKDIAVGNAKGFIDSLNENLDKMGFLGIEPIKITDGFENKFEQGRLIFQVGAMKTVVDGYLEAGGGMGITGDVFTFNVNASIDVAGLASGEFMIARGEDGSFSGTADIEADIANVNAKIHVEYIDGAVTIQGTGKIQSEKFSGEITLLVTDKVKSKQMMNAALGVESMDAEKEQAAAPEPAKATPKSKKNQVLAGWGEVTANITPWLAGTAKVGIDSEGHVTIVGEITVPEDIELMEQRGKKVDLFKVEIRAGYGIPLVGQVFLFASIGMFMNAGFGPLVLKGVGFKGTYSTDPSILQEFEITGTLGINAFAIIGLEAEAGVGVTLLGHDLKAGVNVTAAAGLRAYAEATPTLQYKEQASPEGGKMGETRLKGHFEAAAQLFMQLSGSLFYELDSPWWSPAPDGREDFPLGEVQYPIGDSMGIGADMDWLIGSPEAPELKFSPVEFDPDKFTADVMADPPPRKSGKSDADEKGDWVDGNKPGDQKENPETKDGKGLPDTGKKKEDLKKLPDEQKYMRSLDEMSKLEKASPKPTYAVVKAKASKVKKKYGLDTITVKDKDEKAEVYVKHKKENNKKHLLEVPLMSAAERFKLLKTAMDDLKTRNKKAGGEAGTVTEAEAKELITAWKKAHPVVEEVRVVDGDKTWDYFIDIGDKSETEKGKLKTENANGPEGEVVSDFTINGEKHHFKVILSGKVIEILMASNHFTNLINKIKSFISDLRTGEKQPYTEDGQIQGLIQDLLTFESMIKISEDAIAGVVSKSGQTDNRAKIDEIIEGEMKKHASHINNLFKKHEIKELTDLVIDLLDLNQEIKKLKDVLEQVEKHIKNANSVGDGNSISALAAENYMGWLAIHIDKIMNKNNLTEIGDLGFLSKKKASAKKKAKEKLAAEAAALYPINKSDHRGKINAAVSNREKHVNDNLQPFIQNLNTQLEPHIQDLRTGTPSETTYTSIETIFSSLSIEIGGEAQALGISVDDESMTKLKGMVENFVRFSLINNGIREGVYNVGKPQVHQKKVLGDSEGMGKLLETLGTIEGIIKNHSIPNAGEAKEYEDRLTKALDSIKLAQTFVIDGDKIPELTTSFYTRGNNLLDEMAEVESAISSGTLEQYLKSKPYGSGTLFDLFSGEVSKTKAHKNFAKIDQALRSVYGVAYGDAASVQSFNENN